MGAKILAAYTDPGFRAKQSETSGSPVEPTEEGALYIDAFTGDLIHAEDAPALMAKIEETPNGLFSKAALYAMKQGDLLGGAAIAHPDPEHPTNKARGTPPTAFPVEWEQVYIDLDRYPEDKLTEVRQVIIDAMSHSAYVFEKDRGIGANGQHRGFQKIPVKGERPIFAWGVHREQDRGSHVQIFRHVHSIDRADNPPRIVQAMPLHDNKVRDMELACINQALAAAGFAPLDELVMATRRMASPERADAVQKVNEALATGEELPEPSAAEVNNLKGASFDFRRAAEEAAKQSREAYAASQEALRKAKLFEAAQDAVDSLREQTEARRTTEVENATLKTEVERLGKELTRQAEDHQEAMTQATMAHNVALQTLQEEHATEIAGMKEEHGIELDEAKETAKAEGVAEGQAAAEATFGPRLEEARTAARAEARAEAEAEFAKRLEEARAAARAGGIAAGRAEVEATVPERLDAARAAAKAEGVNEGRALGRAEAEAAIPGREAVAREAGRQDGRAEMAERVKEERDARTELQTMFNQLMEQNRALIDRLNGQAAAPARRPRTPKQ